MSTFRAFWVERTEDKQFPRSLIERDDNDLPEGDLLIEVRYVSMPQRRSFAFVRIELSASAIRQAPRLLRASFNCAPRAPNFLNTLRRPRQ